LCIATPHESAVSKHAVRLAKVDAVKAILKTADCLFVTSKTFSIDTNQITEIIVGMRNQFMTTIMAMHMPCGEGVRMLDGRLE
jgi:hypothetical protein